MDKGEESCGELIIAGSNTTELLEFEEEGFHKMSFLVETPVDVPRVGVIRLWRDTEIRVMVGDKLSKLPLAVGSVCKDGRPLQVNPAEQFFSDGDIVGIAGCQHDLNRVAQSIYNSVNLGTSTSSTHSDALIDLCSVHGNL